MDRFFQLLLIGSLIPLCWLGMMGVHELGHCMAAWASGGIVGRVVLHPFRISHTSLCWNPHPLFVAWGGVVIGTLLPLIVFEAAAGASISYLMQFFAGFCLVMNGVYLAEDAYFRAADGGDIIYWGSPPWLPLAAGIVALSLGLSLWNGLGPSFGLAGAGGKVNRGHAVAVALLLACVILVDVVCN